MNKQTVYIACYGKDSDAQLILPLTNNKSALNGMPHPVKKIESVYVLTEQEMNKIKREAAGNGLKRGYEIGYSGASFESNFTKEDIQSYLNTNYPLTKNTEG